MLIIGNPTNIFLGSAYNIEFIEYLKIMFVPTILAGLVQFSLILLIFNKKLSQPMKNDFEISEIRNKFDFIVSLIHLLICLVMLVISSYLNIAMWLIALGCAVSLLTILIISKIVRKRSLYSIYYTTKRLPFELIPFVISMFIIVIALDKYQVSKLISDFLGETAENLHYCTAALLFTAFLYFLCILLLVMSSEALF